MKSGYVSGDGSAFRDFLLSRLLEIYRLHCVCARVGVRAIAPNVCMCAKAGRVWEKDEDKDGDRT